jgi:Lectin C-type domain
MIVWDARVCLLPVALIACGRVGYELTESGDGTTRAGVAGTGSLVGVGGLTGDVGAGGTLVGGGGQTVSGAGGAGAGGAGAGSTTGGSGGGAGCTVTGVEICDGLDNDCSGTADDGNVCGTGCEGGTYGGHAYVFCVGPLARQEAVTDCGTKSMLLVRIDDAAEGAWVYSMAFKNAGTNNTSSVWRWLGANDIAVNGEWRWQDGAQFWQGAQTGNPVGGLYSNWSMGQPARADNCSMMQNLPSAHWDAMSCTLLQPYVCELY